MASHPVYDKYPLDPTKKMIRVLDVDLSQYQDAPGTDNELIKCTFRIVGYDRPDRAGPAYAALSYAWGDPSDTATIIVNSQEFTVKKSLEKGLRAICRHFSMMAVEHG